MTTPRNVNVPRRLPVALRRGHYPRLISEQQDVGAQPHDTPVEATPSTTITPTPCAKIIFEQSTKSNRAFQQGLDNNPDAESSLQAQLRDRLMRVYHPPRQGPLIGQHCLSQVARVVLDHPTAADQRFGGAKYTDNIEFWMDSWLKFGHFGLWEPNHPGTMIRWYRGAPRRLTPKLARALDRLQREDLDALAFDQQFRGDDLFPRTNLLPQPTHATSCRSAGSAAASRTTADGA